MNSSLKLLAVAVCSLGILSAADAVAPGFMDKLTADSRPAEDQARDGARRPAQVMELLGVEAGMTVIDVGAGGGWYTRVLSAAVGPEGHVVADFGPRALERENGRAGRDLAAGLGNVEASFVPLTDIEPSSFDAAVTALNMHHGNADRNVPYLRNILNLLKPGGRAAIIDHIGSPGMDNGSLHRMLVSDARDWIEAAGFEIVEESDILRTAGDDHARIVFDPALGRNTDRFLFIVRRP